MALVRGMSMLSTRKRKVKITKAKLADFEAKRLIHNKWCKRNGLHDLRYSIVEEYIDYCLGKKKPKQVEEYIDYCLGKKKPKQDFKPLVTETVYRRESVDYPSANGTGMSGGTKKEPMMYTGTLVTGIATMHKSNAVPVINQEQATEISRMAR